MFTCLVREIDYLAKPTTGMQVLKDLLIDDHTPYNDFHVGNILGIYLRGKYRLPINSVKISEKPFIPENSL